MACKECKKNNRIKEEMDKSTEFLSKKIIIFFIVESCKQQLLNQIFNVSFLFFILKHLCSIF
jgi:hypothetical protein